MSNGWSAYDVPFVPVPLWERAKQHKSSFSATCPLSLMPPHRRPSLLCAAIAEWPGLSLLRGTSFGSFAPRPVRYSSHRADIHRLNGKEASS
jgi:hypothetical protein